MQFGQHLIEARLLRRYKRFLADVRLMDGREVTVHCANPGSMLTCIEPGATVWLSRASNPKRKLAWTWEWVELRAGRVFVNPVRANEVVFDAVKHGQVPELAGYAILRREVRYGAGSRIDGLLQGPGDCYVEIKNVTLDLGAGRSAFPDSVTERGRRHLNELIGIKAAGGRAVLFFCAARENAKTVVPADSIDPAYGLALRAAQRAGVELLAYRCRMDSHSVTLDQRIPVVL